MNGKKIVHKKSEAIKKLEALALEQLKQKHPNFPYPPKPKFNDNTANGLTKAVIAYILAMGGQAERISVTGRQIRSGNGFKWIKSSGKVGSADISAVPQGKSLKIEIKCEATGDSVQSDKQKAYQESVEAAGGVYIIVRTFQGFYDWFNNLNL